MDYVLLFVVYIDKVWDITTHRDILEPTALVIEQTWLANCDIRTINIQGLSSNTHGKKVIILRISFLSRSTSNKFVQAFFKSFWVLLSNHAQRKNFDSKLRYSSKILGPQNMILFPCAWVWDSARRDKWRKEEHKSHEIVVISIKQINMYWYSRCDIHSTVDCTYSHHVSVLYVV